MGNSVQTVKNSTKTERKLVLEMRISTKRGKDVELLGEGERERERENDGNRRYIRIACQNFVTMVDACI